MHHPEQVANRRPGNAGRVALIRRGRRLSKRLAEILLVKAAPVGSGRGTVMAGHQQLSPRDQWMRVRLIDVLRRAEEWDAGTSRCTELLEYMPEGNARTVLRFQADMIARRVAKCFTVADALLAMGQTPQGRVRTDRLPMPQTGLRATGRWPTSRTPSRWLARLWP